jgi:GDP-L-fucose synthase
MDRQARIFVAGHRGMVGSALVRRLREGGYESLLLRSRAELDLLDQRAVAEFMAGERPDYVFVAAEKVGGIQANDSLRADFLYQNLVIESNVIGSAHAAGADFVAVCNAIWGKDDPAGEVAKFAELFASTS